SSIPQDGSDAVLVAFDDVAALLCFADCLPLVLVAPTGAFCVAHCGWKGTVAHLASKVALRLAKVSSCDPAQFNVYIGPYIHVECFDVGDQVAAQFAAEFPSGVSVRDTMSAQRRVDLGAAVTCDLLGCGIAPERIADVGKCTVCDQEHFFSYRASSGTCGRHGALAVRIGDSEGRVEYC
ncbi:MAG: polyphenol oxidase family protein, partial [Eggerthellaceae bacterium]|nr:polyphenol oxidase family protein [Eggerthellaceae bacterium]